MASTEEIKRLGEYLEDAVQSVNGHLKIEIISQIPRRERKEKRRKFTLEEIQEIMDVTVIGRLTAYEMDAGRPAGWCPTHNLIFTASEGCIICQQEAHRIRSSTSIPGVKQILVWRTAQLLRHAGPLGLPAITTILRTDADTTLQVLNGLTNLGLVKQAGLGWVWEGKAADLSPLVEFIRLKGKAHGEDLIEVTGWSPEAVFSDLQELHNAGLVDIVEGEGYIWTGDPVLDQELEALDGTETDA